MEEQLQQRVERLEARIDHLEKRERRQRLMRRMLYVGVLLYIVIIGIIYTRLLATF